MCVVYVFIQVCDRIPRVFCQLNAKYVISCARKVGATVFLTPEDVIEVKAKMILTFVASLWTAELASSSSSTKYRA